MTQSHSILITITILIVFLLIMGFVSKGLAWSKVKRVIDRALSRSHLSQVFILAFFIVFVFAFLVFLSASFNPNVEGYDSRFWDALAHFFNPGAFNKEGGISNGWVMIINIAGMILMTGLLISVLSNLLERRVDNLKNGRFYYTFKEHYVIIGYNKMTVSLIKQLSNRYPNSDIVLQTVQDVPAVRHELFSYLSKKIENNVIILSGNRNSGEDLDKLSLPKAEQLFILGESREYDHDSLNIECFKKIHAILAEKKAKPNKPCYVLFDSQSTYTIFQQQDLIELLDKGKGKPLYFLPFNFQELWAQKVFVDNKYACVEDCSEDIDYIPLDREGISLDSDKTVHLVVLGMSKMGIALGVQATHLCHFPNFVNDPKRKTKITFIDEKADQEMHYLQGRYCHLLKEIDYSFEDVEAAYYFDNSKEPNTKGNINKFTDIEWHFIKGRIESPAIQQKIASYCNKETYLTIAVCLNVPTKAIAAGLYLPDAAYQQEDIQILIKQDTPHSILSMLKNSTRYKNVKPFGMLDNCLELEKTDDDIPIIVKYVYDLYYEKQEQAVTIPDIDKLKVKWKDLKTVKKWSNRYNANTIAIKQSAFNIQETDELDDEKIELLAQVEHNRWNIEELLLGYRPTTIDERKDIGTSPEEKDKMKNNFIHNDICPFDEISNLDIEEKEGGNKIEDPKEYDKCLSRALPMIIKYKEDKKKE